MSTQLVPMHSPDEQESSNKSTAPPTPYLSFGSFHLDRQKDELFKDGARVKLQGKVYQALLALLEKPGEIVTREELRQHLWPDDTHVNYDANVNTTVNKLRQVLGDSLDEPAFVNTIPRKGYSFVARVEYLDGPISHLAQQTQNAWRAAELSQGAASGAAIEERAESRTSFFRAALGSRWLTVAVVTLVIASMLFGAALVLYAHRGVQSPAPVSFTGPS